MQINPERPYLCEALVLLSIDVDEKILSYFMLLKMWLVCVDEENLTLVLLDLAKKKFWS